ncbi:MAG: hypothetical protein NC548_56485 [Lachnospiraceae bacterium]|nr:hypothetical protein [Lachnospiraceae bacterium]
MLKIYTSKEIAKQQSKDKSIVSDVEATFTAIFKDKNEMFRDTTSEFILKNIEGMTKRYDNDIIEAKFGPVSLSNISEGGKALLLVTKYNDSCIISTDILGYNSIYLLFELSKTVDIEVISTRVLYHMKPEYTALVNGEEYSGFDISFAMESFLDEE